MVFYVGLALSSLVPRIGTFMIKLPNSADISSKISNLLEETSYFELVSDVAQIYIEKHTESASDIVLKIMQECDVSSPHGANMYAFWNLVLVQLQDDSK